MSRQERVRSVMPAPSPICTACFDFTPDGFQRERRTVIIAPIVIEEKMSGVFQISYACSRSLSCSDKCCRYSRNAKRRNAEEEQPVETFGSALDR